MRKKKPSELEQTIKGIVVCVCCGNKEEQVITDVIPMCSKCMGPALLEKVTVTHE